MGWWLRRNSVRHFPCGCRNSDLGVLTIKHIKNSRKSMEIHHGPWFVPSEYHKLKGNLLWPRLEKDPASQGTNVESDHGKTYSATSFPWAFHHEFGRGRSLRRVCDGAFSLGCFCWYPNKGNFIGKNGDLMRIQAMKSFDELSAASYGCFNSPLVDVDGVFVEQPKQQVSWWIRVDFWSKTDNVLPVQLERLGLGTHPKKG